MGKRPLPDAGAGAGGTAPHRQGHSNHWVAGPGAGGQIRGPLAAVPAGRHLQSEATRLLAEEPSASERARKELIGASASSVQVKSSGITGDWKI
jgi:hypothetical protein